MLSNGTLVSNKSGSIEERNQTSSEMGTGCQRNGYKQRRIICQIVACAANQGVVVCGGLCAGTGCALIRQQANSILT